MMRLETACSEPGVPARSTLISLQLNRIPDEVLKQLGLLTMHNLSKLANECIGGGMRHAAAGLGDRRSLFARLVSAGLAYNGADSWPPRAAVIRS